MRWTLSGKLWPGLSKSKGTNRYRSNFKAHGHFCTALCYFRATFDEANPARGYIDLFLKAQKEGQGEFFTNKDLLIGCQVINSNPPKFSSANLCHFPGFVYSWLRDDKQHFDFDDSLHDFVSGSAEKSAERN